MRFMILIKATPDTEAGVMPSQQLITEMQHYNEQLVSASIMQAGEGLHPTSNAARVHFSGSQRSVAQGPFPNDHHQLICGFWIWSCKSLQEAIDWVKRCPNPTGAQSEIEIRQVFSAEDFGAEFTPELRQKEDRLREQLAAQSKA